MYPLRSSRNELQMPTAEITETTGCSRTLTVNIERELLDNEMQSAVKTIKKDLNLPGFRKGKAPDAILFKRFGASIQQEALRDLIPKVLDEVFTEHGIRPVGEPDISDIDLPEDGPVTMTVKVEEAPVIEPAPFKGLPVTRTVRDLTDEILDHEIERIRQMRAEQEEVERPVDMSDILVVNLQKQDESGVPIIGERIDNHVITLDGRGTPSPQFDEQIVGMNVGETRTVKFTYDDSIENKELVGVTEVYEVELVKHFERRVPELDDAFVESLGADFKTVADFREAMHDRLEKQFADDAERNLNNALIEAFVSNKPFEVPGSMVERVMESELERARTEARGQEYDENELRQRMRPDAVRAVQTWLIVDAVIAEQKIEIKREDVDARIAELAEVTGAETKQLKRRLIKEGQLDDLKHDIARSRAYKWMAEEAEVTDETMPETPEESRIVNP
jgi:trigger factor